MIWMLRTTVKRIGINFKSTYEDLMDYAKREVVFLTENYDHEEK